MKRSKVLIELDFIYSRLRRLRLANRHAPWFVCLIRSIEELVAAVIKILINLDKASK